MRAARFDQDLGKLTVAHVPLPAVGDTDVLVRIKACGICLSDVHLLDGSMPARKSILTPGHETAGVIEQVGADVPGWKVGDRVVLNSCRTCGRCRECVSGIAERCSDPQIMGFDYDGGWAEFIAVPYVELCAMPDDLPFEQAAILADAVSTPYAGLVAAGGLRPGQSVGLWGIGGLGLHAVLVARCIGAAPIIAVDPRERARKAALEAGADFVLAPGDPDLVARVRDLTDGVGLDLAVDLAGSNEVLRQGNACLARRGALLIIGLSPEPIHLGAADVFGNNAYQLIGHLGYRKSHLEEVLKLVRYGRLDVSRSVSSIVSLDEISAGVDALASKESDPIRIVMVP